MYAIHLARADGCMSEANQRAEDAGNRVNVEHLVPKKIPTDLWNIPKGTVPQNTNEMKGF